MKTVKAIKDHRYAGKFRKAGTTYELPDGIAILYAKIGRIVEVVQPVIKRPLISPYITRDIEPEADESTPRKKRYYKRRDMSAEE